MRPQPLELRSGEGLRAVSLRPTARTGSSLQHGEVLGGAGWKTLKGGREKNVYKPLCVLRSSPDSVTAVRASEGGSALSVSSSTGETLVWSVKVTQHVSNTILQMETGEGTPYHSVAYF